MLKLGLTGGIGAGKSTAARHLAELGAVVVDADRLAREVVEPGTEGLAAVVQAFGEGILACDGTLERRALGARVFADAEARQMLNGILHPRIAALTAERLAALPPDAIAVHDVPLLVENRMGAGYHLVLVVHAPVEERVRRLVAYRGMTQDDARTRIAAQADDAARRAAADVWLGNDGPAWDVCMQLDRLWTGRLVAFERNLRERRPAPVELGATITEADPGWAAQADRLAARVVRALGEPSVRVDHVGSTSVPGLAARDVVDLQVVVPGVIGDDVHERLASAGFVGYDDVGPVHDPGPDGAEVLYEYVSADPGRRATLAVRSARGTIWQDALLFRDWLRAHDAERDAYATVKRQMSGTGLISYRARMAPWIGAGLGRAREWGRRVGWAPVDREE